MICNLMYYLLVISVYLIDNKFELSPRREGAAQTVRADGSAQVPTDETAGGDGEEGGQASMYSIA